MAGKQLSAEFFVDRFGTVVPKAQPLKRAQAFAIFKRDHGTCHRCGEPVKFGGQTVSAFETIRSSAVDHILARARGGQNTDDNLQLLCVTCNARKGAK